MTCSSAARAVLADLRVCLCAGDDLAGEFELAAPIGQGCRWLSYAFLVIYVLPLTTIGVWRMLRRPSRAGPDQAASIRTV